jgi:hypothetical protein
MTRSVIAAKIAAGMDFAQLSQARKDDFFQELQQKIRESAEDWQRRGVPRQAEFFMEVAENLHQLSAEFKWFNHLEVAWEN